MRRIRFLQIGSFPSSTIHNLTVLLTRLQDGYDFVFEDEPLEVPNARAMADGTYPEKYLENAAADFMHSRRYTEYPITITNLPLPEQVASSNDAHAALLSFHDWDRYTHYPLIEFLAYLVGAVLVDLHITTEAHYDTRGCPNDFSDNREDINVGMARGEFCDVCKRTLLAGLETGRITQRELTAINRILDHVAHRKICFVLMPFRDKFAAAYQAIGNAVKASGYVCRRADEIFETKAIVQIIYEFIGRAEVIVADLTDRNPNVFYELGYAHALGKSTILLTQNPEDVPFDLRHRQYILYSTEDLERTLEARVRSYFQAPKAGSPLKP